MSVTLDLTKKLELSLEKKGVVDVPKLEVRLAVDKSGSMQDEYADGLVEAIINRFIIAGMKFDDNQSLDVGFFNDSFREAPSAYAQDAGNYLRTKAKSLMNWWGGTNYAPIIEAFETRQVILEEAGAAKSGGIFGLFSKKPALPEGTSKFRGYCGIITDGDNFDKSQFERALRSTSGDTYYEFIAIGMDIRPDYLTSIAKNYKHVGFTHVKYPKSIGDQEFYDALINDKFVAWLG